VDDSGYKNFRLEASANAKVFLNRLARKDTAAATPPVSGRELT